MRASFLILLAAIGCGGSRGNVLPATPSKGMPFVAHGASALSSFPTGGCCSATSTGSATSTNQTAEIDLLTTIAANTTGGGSLPVGAATAARQDTGNTSLASIDTKTPALVGGRVPVDPSGVTSPVSIAAPVAVTGPLTDTQLRASPVPTSLASVPLPSGAATAALQTTGNSSLASIYAQLLATLTADVSDRAGRLLGVVYGSQAQQLQQSPTNYNLYTELRTGGSAYDGRLIRALTSADVVTIVPSGTQTVTGPLTDTQLRASAVPVSMSAPPTGGATAALQTGGNASLTSIDGKTATLVSGRVPVDPSGVTSPVSIAATVAVSAAALPLPTGAATSVLQGAGLPVALVGGRLDVNIGASTSLTVTGPLTDTQLRTTPVPVSGTVNLGTTAGGAGQLALDATLTGGTQTTRITDGTNTATVKAASTAAGATDKALVVAVSPNNTVGVSGTFWQSTQPTSNAGASQVDGHSANIGALADASSASTLTGLLKAIKTAVQGAVTTTTGGSSVSFISSAATTAVATTAAVLRGVSITTGGALGDTLKIYDCNNCTSNERVELAYNNLQSVIWPSGISFANGITVVSTGTLGRSTVVFN